MKSSEVRYTRNNNIVMRQIAGETLLIPITQAGAELQKLYTLNDTAAELWGKMASPRSIREMAISLHEEYAGVGCHRMAGH